MDMISCCMCLFAKGGSKDAYFNLISSSAACTTATLPSQKTDSLCRQLHGAECFPSHIYNTEDTSYEGRI